MDIRSQITRVLSKKYDNQKQLKDLLEYKGQKLKVFLFQT